MMSISPDSGLISDLSRRIDESLSRLLKPGQRVALLNFPNHSNAGDSALWLGQLESLRRLNVRIVYKASWASYRREDLSRVMGAEDVILFNSGGNFGDLYLHNQATVRLKVLREFPHIRTIQLPQSIWYEKQENADHMRRICEAHRDFTLMVRDNHSLEIAQEHFQVPIQLCPDMAFAMGPQKRARNSRTDILWLCRTDVEATGYSPPKEGDGLEVVDWLQPLDDEDAASFHARAVSALNQRLHLSAKRNQMTSVNRRLLQATFLPMARLWMRRGCSILARGDVVITDRLHGHLLAMFQGIPHVLIDNSYGKLRSMFETWTNGSATAHWADSPEEALDIARSLVQSQRGG